MMQNYERKHLYILSAIGILLLSPLYIFVGPFIFQGILFDDTTVWLIQTPSPAYWLYAASSIGLAACLFLAYFFKRLSIWLTILGLAAAGICFTFGTFNYQSLSSDKIAWSELASLKSHDYSWEEVEEVILTVPETEEDKHKMEFYFKDGNRVTFIRDLEFTQQFHHFNSLKRQYNIPYKADDT